MYYTPKQVWQLKLRETIIKKRYLFYEEPFQIVEGVDQVNRSFWYINKGSGCFGGKKALISNDSRFHASKCSFSMKRLFPKNDIDKPVTIMSVNL